MTAETSNARGDVRGLVAKWRNESESEHHLAYKLREFGDRDVADLRLGYATVLHNCASELESSLAAEGVQAGEIEQRRGEVVAWVAEFPDGWKEFAADGEPEVTEWQTWRQPPSTIRPLAYADIAHLSTPADWRERLEALSSRYEPNSPVGAGIDAAIRELAAAPPPAAARGDVRGLVAKWRGLANEALRRSGTWNGNDVADRIEFMADELEALAAEGVQAGEVSDVAEVWMFKGTDGAWHTFHNEKHRLDTIADGRWDVRKFAALAQEHGK